MAPLLQSVRRVYKAKVLIFTLHHTRFICCNTRDSNTTISNLIHICLSPHLTGGIGHDARSNLLIARTFSRCIRARRFCREPQYRARQCPLSSRSRADGPWPVCPSGAHSLRRRLVARRVALREVRAACGARSRRLRCASRPAGNSPYERMPGGGDREGRTRLSQMAIELGSQWKRTWKSGFSLSWWNSRLRIASDSDFGTPTMRRVKPVAQTWLVLASGGEGEAAHQGSRRSTSTLLQG